MLGHASVSITLDLYSHVIPDMPQDAAAIVADVLERPSEAL
jgi:integrase